MMYFFIATATFKGDPVRCQFGVDARCKGTAEFVARKHLGEIAPQLTSEAWKLKHVDKLPTINPDKVVVLDPIKPDPFRWKG